MRGTVLTSVFVHHSCFIQCFGFIFGSPDHAPDGVRRFDVNSDTVLADLTAKCLRDTLNIGQRDVSFRWSILPVSRFWFDFLAGR